MHWKLFFAFLDTGESGEPARSVPCGSCPSPASERLTAVRYDTCLGRME